MKVLMIVSWYSKYNDKNIKEGIFHYEQAKDLQSKCDVAIYFPFDTHIKPFFISNIENDIRLYRSRSTWKFLNIFVAIWSFLKIKKEYCPEIIHAHSAVGAGYIAVILGKLFKIPVLVTEHMPVEMINFDRYITKKKIEWCYKNSCINVCVSDDLRTKLRKIYNDIDFTTIYNGISKPNMIPSYKKYRMENMINCCIVAGFYSKDIKGYQYLLPALKQLILEGHSIMLHVCGDGIYFEYYKNLAVELKIDNNCIFHGHCRKEEVYDLISQMDFCISSSIIESAGVYVQEAMLLGKPLVVTKSGGANSLVNDKIAIVVEKGSTKALVEGIKKMILTYKDYDSYYIKNYAKNKFAMESINKRYIDLYYEIIKNKGI